MAHRFEHLDRQRRVMMWLFGLLVAAMCAALVLVSWTSESPAIQFEQRWPSLAGLAGLVVLFILYVQHKHRQLAQLEARLRDVAVREATLQARFSELSFLFDTTTQLQLRLDPDRMLELAAQRLIPCLDAHQSSIMMYNEQTQMLEVKAAAGIESERVVNAIVKPGEGIAGHVFTSGESLILTPEIVKARFTDTLDWGREIVAGLCVPMRFRGHTLGVINVTRGSGEPFSQAHARILTSFAEHCAATVLKAQHHHDLLKTSRAA